jgi:hypothetical protein
MTRRIGGSFAPPVSDETLASYDRQIAALPDSPIKSALQTCLTCVKQWWELPESTGGGRPHPVGVGYIVDLDKQHQATLWEAIPWKHEIEAIQKLFDDIPADTQRDLRNMAFHLLWHVKELDLDREPMTADKL